MGARRQLVATLERLLLLAVFLLASLGEPARALIRGTAPGQSGVPQQGEALRRWEGAYSAICVPAADPNIGFVAHGNPVNGVDPSGHEFSFIGTLTSLTTAEGLQGLMSHDAGHAFQDWLEKNIFKRVLAENVSVSSTTRHSVDFELDNALIEAKNALNIDATQLAYIAVKAKELGKDFCYVFLKKTSQWVIDKIKNKGGSVSWFLDESD